MTKYKVLRRCLDLGKTVEDLINYLEWACEQGKCQIVGISEVCDQNGDRVSKNDKIFIFVVYN